MNLDHHDVARGGVRTITGDFWFGGVGGAVSFFVTLRTGAGCCLGVARVYVRTSVPSWGVSIFPSDSVITPT